MIDFVFFDIGGTLGERNPASGSFTVFPSSAGLVIGALSAKSR